VEPVQSAVAGPDMKVLGGPAHARRALRHTHHCDDCGYERDTECPWSSRPPQASSRTSSLVREMSRRLVLRMGPAYPLARGTFLVGGAARDEPPHHCAPGPGARLTLRGNVLNSAIRTFVPVPFSVGFRRPRVIK
jgi:hypothetical protein